ncbi:hypothetical protein ACIBI8_22450 [Streptomyces sp. NPDC050529]|uniref:hypothetical protein n=1 Tax=unclassified Streptomyces TaxID=2593676 RepID=UPI002DD8E489|nr:hypothetical protein [Streptomyces sp. NBC_01022]WRZ79680.1 hypothetical protein OG316_05120 [Streptomyces sp. NBC_01022]
MRPGVNGFGLGEACGDYAVAGVGGALAQTGRRMLMTLCLVLLVLLVVKQPTGALTKGVVVTGIMLAVWGLTRAWGLVSARLGLRRCYLFPGGLVVTGLFGRPRGVVAWSEVTALNVMVTGSLLMAFHRFEVERRGAGRLAFLAMGMEPGLVEPLLSRAAANGVGR